MNKPDVKVIAMSDLHGFLPKITESCDLVMIAGDIVPLEYQTDVILSTAWLVGTFAPWAQNLPCEKVIFIAGNHDFIFQADKQSTAKKIKKKLFPGQLTSKFDKLVYLQDSSFEYQGYRIYGTPWIPDLAGWAFYGDYEKLTEVFSNIPKKLDVLLTHAPTHYANTGTVHQQGRNYLRDFGCSELSEAVASRNIRYVISGHVHSGNHTLTYDTELDTHFVCVSIKDEYYVPVYDYKVIHLGERGITGEIEGAF